MLKTFIKNSDWIGRLYYLIAKCGYWILDVIIPVDHHLILFCSFSGRQVSDVRRQFMITDARSAILKISHGLGSYES